MESFVNRIHFFDGDNPASVSVTITSTNASDALNQLHGLGWRCDRRRWLGFGNVTGTIAAMISTSTKIISDRTRRGQIRQTGWFP